jgi:hypothetical protein
MGIRHVRAGLISADDCRSKFERLEATRATGRAIQHVDTAR